MFPLACLLYTQRVELRLADDDGLGQLFEVGIRSHELRAVASGRGIDDGVGQGQAVDERDVGGLECERFVGRRNDGAAHRRHGGQRAFLRDVTPDDLVDLVDFDRGDEQGLAAFEVGGEAPSQRSIGQVFDPAAGIDEDQNRSFFSRNARGVAPDAMPR